MSIALRENRLQCILSGRWCCVLLRGPVLDNY